MGPTQPGIAIPGERFAEAAAALAFARDPLTGYFWCMFRPNRPAAHEGI
jgi:hypothetical protein